MPFKTKMTQKKRRFAKITPFTVNLTGKMHNFSKENAGFLNNS